MKSGCRAGIVYMVLLMLSSMFFAGNVLCQDKLEWKTYVQIEVFDDYSACWVVQRKALLRNDTEENLFYQYYSEMSPDELLDNIVSMVSDASLITGRAMQVVMEGEFEVSYSISLSAFGKEGILQYQFGWLGFAERIEGEKMKVGDALSGELDLSPDDVLTIIYPDGYVPILVSPSPDKVDYNERVLTWVGTKNFGRGEPTIILEKEGSEWAEIVGKYAIVVFAGVVVVISGFLGYFAGRKRFRGRGELKPKIAKDLSILGVESDEEKVLRLLAEAGGRLLQSTIAKQCGFSKSKGSVLLSEMERKGLISREKSGRGKIVTLKDRA